MQNVSVKDYKLKLDSTPWRLITPVSADVDWCVIWLQGYTSAMDSHLESVKRMVAISGIAFATVDVAGHGMHPQSLDTATREQQLTELVGVYDELRASGYEKMVVVGNSFGGYMSALLCGKRSFAALILRAPAMFKDEEFTLPYQDTPRGKTNSVTPEKEWWLHVTNETSNQALRCVKQFDRPVYVMRHELDNVVPEPVARAYFDVAQLGNYIVVPGIGHFPAQATRPQSYYTYIEHWIVSIVQAVQIQPTTR